MPYKVMIIFGTRPEAIKMMPVVKAIRLRPELSPIVVSTGQHREMLIQVLDTFSESVDVDLEIMSKDQTLEGLTQVALSKVSDVIKLCRPHIVMVHGDTTTAMASALAAFYAKIPVAHVEAGLRSNDLRRPWPEEFNRLVIDALADLLFAPTAEAANNLRRESPRNRHITVTGNTGIDALLDVAKRSGKVIPSTLGLPEIEPGKKIVLVTGHRRESFGVGFQNICEGIRKIASRPDVVVIYPVHLNPNVKGVVLQQLGNLKNVHLINPVSYSEMVALMSAAKILLTDSGGIQEEGPALGKPVIVMREVTERPEAVEAGVATLVGTNPDRMAAEVELLLDNQEIYKSRARAIFPYGDGNAAGRIAASVVDFCSLANTD